MIINEGMTPAQGEVEDSLAQIGFVVVDRIVCAQGPAKGELLFTGRSGDDLRPHRLSYLDGGGADASGRAQHEQRLARLEMTTVPQCMQRGGIGDDERRGGLEVHSGRQGRYAVSRDQALLGESTASG